MCESRPAALRRVCRAKKRLTRGCRKRPESPQRRGKRSCSPKNHPRPSFTGISILPPPVTKVTTFQFWEIISLNAPHNLLPYNFLRRPPASIHSPITSPKTVGAGIARPRFLERPFVWDGPLLRPPQSIPPQRPSTITPRFSGTPNSQRPPTPTPVGANCVRPQSIKTL